MSSKVAAAKMAAWSGVRTVIAAADRPNVLLDALAGSAGVGTVVRARDRRLAARKLWIAFAVGSSGTVVVDQGARNALLARGVSLLPAGVKDVRGEFGAEAAVEIAGPDGAILAKGLTRIGSAQLRTVAGRRSADLPDGVSNVVIHRDDLVVVPA